MKIPKLYIGLIIGIILGLAIGAFLWSGLITLPSNTNAIHSPYAGQEERGKNNNLFITYP